MVQKIFDIIPPKEAKKIIPPEPKILEKPVISKRAFRIDSKKLIIVAFLIFILIGLAYFSYSIKTKVSLWPSLESVSISKTVMVDLNQKELSLENGIIPGKIFKDQKAGSQTFSSSGKVVKEEKAKGVIRVYNNYSESPQPLATNTRFVSSDGKLFKSISKVTIPGKKPDSKGKLVAGEIDVEVQAAESGTDYNIGPSTFSIPGFAGTSKYASFYGKSASSMSGGYKGEVSQITQSDIDNARASLREKLEEDSIGFMKSSTGKGLVLLENAIYQKVLEEKYTVKAGDIADSFEIQSKIESVGIMFKKPDVEDYAKSAVASKIEGGKSVLDKSLEINYSIEKDQSVKPNDYTFDKMIMNLDVKAQLYTSINELELKKAIAGKSSDEAKALLANYQDISKSVIGKETFWRRRIPGDINRIDINLNF